MKNSENKNIDDVEVKDLGLSSKDSPKSQRIVNPDGSFNIERMGIHPFDSFNIYHFLVTISWIQFIVLILCGYVVINAFFAIVYILIGVEHFEGIKSVSAITQFFEAFFFSAQTFTTVGYGRINPTGFLASFVAALESLTGLLAFAIATGLLYGRFSRPVTRLIFSANAIIAPFKDMTAFQFRVANKQKSQMIDVQVQVIFSKLINTNGDIKRKFYTLELEYSKINFFPSTWTVNHPITEDSPLYGLTEKNFDDDDVQFLILLKGFDDTFGQYVHTRFSYIDNEIVWGVKFSNLYNVDDEGKTIIHLDRINQFEPSS